MAKGKRVSRQLHKKNHTPTVTRWAKRKQEETRETISRAADDLSIKGSRFNMFMGECHLHKAKNDARRREHKMLETTSLGDLIK